MLFGRAMEISQLSDYNFVSLVANYNDLVDGEKNRLSPALETRGYTPEQLALAQSSLGEKFSTVVSCGLRFTKPFGHLKFASLSYVLMLFENYERGSLPFPGAVSEQPAQIMEIFNVLKQLKHEVETRTRSASKPQNPKRR